jgi:hypothetical protein
VPDSHPDSYALSVKTGPGKLQNFLIRCTHDAFELGPAEKAARSERWGQYLVSTVPNAGPGLGRAYLQV